MQTKVAMTNRLVYRRPVRMNGDLPMSYWDEKPLNRQLFHVAAGRPLQNGEPLSCALCGVITTVRKNLVVHHRHYRSLGNESQIDLVILCKDCHTWLHERVNLGNLCFMDIPFVDSEWKEYLLETVGNPNCQLCERPLILKWGRTNVYWGCSQYPKCSGSQKYL